MPLRHLAAIGVLLAVPAAGCSPDTTPAAPTGTRADGTSTGALRLTVDAAPDLPEPLANNAVASASLDGREWLFTFLGLRAGKDYRAITTRAYALDVQAGRWERLPDVPGPAGRLAATAQTVGGRVYILGGYAVAADGTETTSPAVDVYDIRARRYTRGADIPVPVDDSVSGLWRDRYIVLVGGWSTSRNVADVQVYDTVADRWLAATPIIGTPVFGHAGAMVGDVIVYCDGARMQAPLVPKYVPARECHRGDLDATDPSRVAWRAIAHYPGPARYRSASAPVQEGRTRGVLFTGGTVNPYNYDGIGYDGQPAEPDAAGWIYDVDQDAWSAGPSLPHPTMDHRALARLDGRWWTIGGFDPGQAVTTRVTRITASR